MELEDILSLAKTGANITITIHRSKEDLVRIVKEMKVGGGHLTVRGRRKDLGLLLQIANINPEKITFDLSVS